VPEANARERKRQRHAAKRAELLGILVAPLPAPIPAPDRVGISIMQLDARSCRYPLWSNEAKPSDKLYCGVETEEGAVYCAHCSQLCYSPRRTEALDRKLGFFKLPRAA